MTNALPIIIAGGGIGGLTSAVALAQRGIETLVLERAPVLREAGAGITVQTNAYEDSRRARANWFVKQSERMGEIAQLRNPVGRAFRNAALKTRPDSATVRSVRKMYTPVPDPRAER